MFQAPRRFLEIGETRFWNTGGVGWRGIQDAIEED